MTFRSPWSRFSMSLIGLACLTAALQFFLTLPGFPSIYRGLDFERRPALPHLKRGFSTRPHAQYKGVIHTQNKDDETVVQLEGLPAQRYVVRFKARFPSTNHQIAVLLNEHPIGTAIPKQIGVAQKFKFSARPGQIRQDINHLRFVHSGIRAAVNYEMLEFRNYWLTSELGNVRIYFDGPWIEHALWRSLWRLPLIAALWIVIYAALGAPALALLTAGLRVNPVTAVKVVTGFILAPVVSHMAGYAVTLLTPITVCVAPSWFMVATVVPLVILNALLTVGSLFRAMALSAWFLLVRTWFMVLQTRTPVKGVVRGFVAVLWYGIVLLLRWFWGDLAHRTFAAFIALYVAGGLCLMLDWRAGAERLIEWAFGCLIVALITFGLRHIRAADRVRGGPEA